MSASAATRTYDCKTSNCTGEARSPVGRYSYCDTCRESRDRRAAETGAPASLPQLARQTPQTHQERARAATKTLVTIGRRLDRAKERATKATVELKDAQSDWDAEVRRLGNMS